MSALTKKKYVIAEALDHIELEKGENVQMVVSSPGSQLFEVEDEFGVRTLASLPQKFRKTIWLKRKDFVVCIPIFEGNKVKYEITKILQPHHLKDLNISTKFPAMFSNEVGQGDGHGADSCNECDSDNDSLPEINNRRLVEIESSSDEESSEDEESQSDNDSIPDLE